MKRLAAALGLLIGLMAVPGVAMAAPATPLQACILRQALPEANSGDALDRMDKARGVCFDVAADEQRLRILKVNERIYENQLLEANVLLVVVTAITLSGVALSALQLYASYRLALVGHGVLADGGEVDLHANSIAVKSSVVGVVILTISLAFYALFIVYVYQIRPYAGITSLGSSAGPSAPPNVPSPPPPPGMKAVPR
ncbi:MAG: hypothetical protein ABI376_09690 [Caulobacteraceae bacterium]